jgi:HEAT repeat protein
MGALQRRDIQHMLLDQDPGVRRRAAQAAARRADVDLFDTLHDEDWSVIEMACWAKGEHEAADQRTLARIVDLAATHAEPLVREAAVAALGAIGAPTGLPAVLRATHDKPAVRRRAAIALAAFEGPEVQAALERLLRDRDWQTRQVAEDLLQRP